MKKAARYIHLWMSLPSGIMLTLICLTGAIMVFQTEIEEMVFRDRYYADTVAGERLRADEIVNTANSRLTNDTITAIKVSADPARNIVGTLASGQRAYVYINPYTAEIEGYSNARQGFFHKVMILHRWLMLPDRETGKAIIGISTIFMIVILVTGLMRWWPKRRTANSFSIKWRNANMCRRILGLHKVVGMYAALALLIMALSGLMWSFEWYRSSVAVLFGIETAQHNHSSGGKEKNGRKATVGLWEKALAKAAEENPGYQNISVTRNGEITVLPSSALHPRATDRYRYRADTGILDSTGKYGEKKNSAYMMSVAYVLHTGAWGGMATKILWFIATLVGATLPITGYILYFKYIK